MKRNNLIALILGIICASLLWQYYLYPKYNKKVQDPQTMQDLLEADTQALDEELSSIPGELLFRTDLNTQESAQNQNIVYQEDPSLPKETISLIEVPAKYKLIKSEAEYKKIKDQLIAPPEKINFSKEMLIAIESSDQLSDSFFQIKDIQNNGKEIIVSYRFNFIGAKDRVDKISAQKTLKSNLPIVLQQVL